MAQIGTLDVGSIVKLNVNGVSKEFIIVHQGIPSTKYDSSCDGTWLLMQGVYTKSAWGNGSNSYKDSYMISILNNTFFGQLDSDIQTVVKQVKIPYHDGAGNGGTVKDKANGLSTRVFLLSGYELGWTTSDSGYFTVDGSRLTGFCGINSERICYSNGAAVNWWTRSPRTNNAENVAYVKTTGGYDGGKYDNSFYVRPAMVLESSTPVTQDGTVVLNDSPTATANETSLGVRSEPFAWNYKVSDPEGDYINVNEYFDGKYVNSRSSVSSGSTLFFSYTNEKSNFRQIANGNHTLTVIPSDNYTSGTALTATWTKAVYAASIMLLEPLTVTGDIEVAILSVSGSIPEDANYKVEVTNNAMDPVPVWQNCTEEVKNGQNIVFENKTTVNGAAFNFRVSVSRGASGVGGYIDAVRGAFQ